MTEKKTTILSLGNAFGQSDLELSHLERHGFTVIEAKPQVDIGAQCVKHDIDVIITGPITASSPDIVTRQGIPETVPILCLGKDNMVQDMFSSIVSCLPPPFSSSILLEHLSLLTTIRMMSKTVQEKNMHISMLSRKLEQQQKSIEQHSDFLDVLATRDGLTGLFNRRQLNKMLEETFRACMQNDSDLSLLIFDIDYFYEINKSTGSSYGDFVLNDFAARITSTVQSQGSCFRFSGEIFMVLLPGKTLEQAMDLAESIRSELHVRPFVRGNESRIVTISAGVVNLEEHQPENPDEFITMAERALFNAKSEGRDRVVSYQDILRDSKSTPQHDLRFLKETLSRILDRTRTSAIDSLQLLAKDIAGQKNRAHIENVQHYVDLLGQYLRLPDTLVETFKNATTLHTSVRFLLHNELINQKASFSPDDREIMDDFPYKLAEITELFDYFSNERAILLFHGERYDGTGYPEGLKGEEIPLGARIFSLMDALAAMSADRPHRDKLTPEEILSELTAGAGFQFDPYLVIKTLELIKAHRLFRINPQLIDSSIAMITESLSQQTP